MSKEVSHYVVTAHPPGAVFHSTKCNFLAPDASNAVLAKSHRLEVRELRSEPFPVVLQVPVNGRITSLLSFNLPSSPTAYLFFTTDSLRFAVVSYDPTLSPYPLRTHASGSLQVSNSKPADAGPVVALDPLQRCIALHLVDGFVHIIPIHANYRYEPIKTGKSSHTDKRSFASSSGGGRRGGAASSSLVLGEPFHCRIEEALILSLSFVPQPDAVLPLLAVLHQDARGSQHLISHAVNVPQRQLLLYGSHSSAAALTQWIKKLHVDGGSSLLIPVAPICGSSSVAAAATATATVDAAVLGTSPSLAASGAVLILGQKNFTYVSPTATKVLPVAQALYLTYVPLPPEPHTSSPRFLIGDEFGNLHMLTLVVVPATFPFAAAAASTLSDAVGPSAIPPPPSTTVVRLQLDTLGSCTIANTLCYLDQGVVFVGSVLGDSQLVQISDEPIEEDAETMESTYLSVIEEYTNLGPILDFDLIPTQDGLAQSQVVTASGSSQSGSLRLIRNGIGMNESAAVEIPGIQAMWSVKHRENVDAFLVQSFVGETRVLGVVGEGLEEVVLPGLDASCSSLYVGNVGPSTSSSMLLLLQVTPTEARLLDAEGGVLLDSYAADITVAAANRSQVAVALRGGTVVLFAVEGQKLVRRGERRMGREISCLDVRPFLPRDAMQVDDGQMNEPESDYLAVGLWDDFTVRLLSTAPSAALELEELLCVNLEDEEEDATAPAGSASRRNRSNLMARSLCMLTLDFNNNSSNNSGGAGIPGVDMLFVGLGDGTLISSAVVAHDGQLSVRSKKEVCLGTQRIDLIPLHTERGGACVLATGDRPTVIYLAGVSGNSSNLTNPKLCYSNVNLSSSDDDDNDEIGRHKAQQCIAVNVACPFFTPFLFDPLGQQHYSLCVADDTHLRLGVIDDIQKLHVTTCRLGMAPRRLAHCSSGRLFAVGCVESGLAIGLSENEGNMTNCIRFMDDTTFDDIERIAMEPFEMILSMAYVTLKIPSTGKNASDGLVASESDSATFKAFLLVGTAFALPDEDEPSRGRILVYSFQNEDAVTSPSRVIRQVTEMSTNGGVYSICQFYDGKVLCAVNTKTMLCHLVDDTGMRRLDYLGAGHHGHILSLCVKSRAKGTEQDRLSSNAGTIMDEQQQSPAKDEERAPEMLAIVGDLMRSVSLVQYYPEHETLEEIARDFTSNWTTSCEMLTDHVYLAAENFHNMYCLRRNHASSEEVRCRLDTIGEFHFGEQCNKFMSGSLVMPVSSSSTSAASSSGAPSSDAKHARRRHQSPKKTGAAAHSRARRAIVTTGSQVLFGTVEGTLGVVLGLDGRTAAFFTALERAMAEVVQPVGDLSHAAHRAVQGPSRSYPAHGFVDGDLVESFLDLDRGLMEAVVREMNRDGGWEADDSLLREKKEKGGGGDDPDEEQFRADLTVEDVLAMVEEMTMLH